MKITIYTITDCQFSNQEKEYLKINNLSFEEKNLETNKEYLTEMLAVSNNFAGTPVTKIEKDDGQIVVMKGFTKEEFDKTLGLTSSSQMPTPPSDAPTSTPTPPTATPTEPTIPTPPVPTPPVETPPPVEPPKPAEPETVPSVIEPPDSNSSPTPEPTTTTTDPQLSSILNDLQSKIEETPKDKPVEVAPPQVVSTPSTPPVIPDPGFK